MPRPDGPAHDLRRLIEVLDRHGVEYLFVGGVAANAHGATRPTDDADCVVRRERDNLDRLAAALRELNARLRVRGMTDAEARTLPVQIDGLALETAGMTTWMTDAGPFDVLAGLEAPDGRLLAYEELVERVTVFQGDGFAIRTAALDDIINAKQRADRPKDRDVLPELREIREREHRETMPELLPELRELIESGPMVHLSTINPDGSPQVTVIWVGLDGDDLVSTHMRDNVKLKNIRRDPRVALSFDVPREPGVWINPYAVIYARATVEPSPRIWELMTKHAKVYVSADAEIPAPEGSEPGFIVRYSITRIGGIGPWATNHSQ